MCIYVYVSSNIVSHLWTSDACVYMCISVQISSQICELNAEWNTYYTFKYSIQWRYPSIHIYSIMREWKYTSKFYIPCCKIFKYIHHIEQIVRNHTFNSNTVSLQTSGIYNVKIPLPTSYKTALVNRIHFI